ncbi:DUF262 domain-containing protein [Vibrio sp. 10N.222.55.C12]|uniref:DUF262 domain-containing protein n=1 Tax=Vibrio sp. 10N.222.55.C12 TaxID=1884470 RepID=UPI000C83D884|nr:DUF262 domain-containing protein [Vibrio sp. 10N.222.55.C12]PMN96610.1 hypothetical protein BCT20_02280 [Vibrio sp. 10N.222.55.C12]
MEIPNPICKVKDLIADPRLTIPPYQRPYKWTQKNLADLLEDLQTYRDKPCYRLGTIVFHHHSDNKDKKEQLDIVDGQQRTLTLILLIKAILTVKDIESITRQDLKADLEKLSGEIESFLFRHKFNSDITHQNLHQNYLSAQRAVSRHEFTESDIDFLLNHCEVVTFVLRDISEAFQFFDSQNARGRDLNPHDLLKAYHLREFSEADIYLKGQSVSHWESLDGNELAGLFANYLFRIRRWVQGRDALNFDKTKIDLFKGINLESVEQYPYVEQVLIVHHFVDEYNQSYHRHVDQQYRAFPFHLDQMIVNGRRFFEMTTHYQLMIEGIVTSEYRDGNTKIMGYQLSEQAQKILKTLSEYGARSRIGDRYIRTIFDCAVIFYIDKFGNHHLSEAIEKIFIWAYRCRLERYVVQLATMNNHVLNSNIFVKMKHSVKPSEILNWPLDSVTELKGTKLDDVVKLFEEMKYYEPK